MNTEKIEKLKKGLSNSKISDDIKEKIKSEIEKLEKMDAKEKAEHESKETQAKENAEHKEVTPKAKSTGGTKKTAMSLAKEIRKEGESWSDAVKRAGKEMKGIKEDVKKETKSEIAKLKSLIRTRKDLKGVSKSNLLRDGQRKALPSGKRTSATGHTYYENRRNRTDKGKVGDLYLAKGGEIDNSIIDELWRGYASAILFTETDMDSGEPLDSEFSIYDFNKESETNAKKMLSQYYSKYKDAIEESELDLETVGNDIWYTQSGQGAGFFDHSLDQEVEDKLTKGAEEFGKFPSTETYRGKVIIRGGKSYAEGGAIPNNYEGKTPEQVWNKLTTSQRHHFLHDHNDEIESTPMSIEDNTKKSYKFLPTKVKVSFKKHIETGEYANGGMMSNMSVHDGTSFMNTPVYAEGGEIADIQKMKKTLIAKAKSKGIYEDFGQKEVRILEDKYGYTNNVKQFDDWAMNFDSSQYAEGGFMDGVYAEEGAEIYRKKYEFRKPYEGQSVILTNTKNPIRHTFINKEIVLENKNSNGSFSGFVRNTGDKVPFDLYPEDFEQYENGGFMDGAYAEEGAMVNKDGIRVKSVAMPEKELTEAEWMAKHSDSKEARTYAVGGGIFSDAFTGYTGTHYTALVGETNAMSSGEMFADGGGVGQKKYNIKFNVGKARYVINTYDGVKKHKDGSEFYDIHIFKTKPMFDEFQNKLIKEGYKYTYSDGGAVMQNQQLIHDATMNTAEMFAKEGIPAYVPVYEQGGNINIENPNFMNNVYARGGGVTPRLKKGDDVLIIGRRWFDRANGNTYHTAEVQVNGNFVGKSDMTYGYDDYYVQTGKEILLQHYKLPKGMEDRSPLWQLRDYKVTFRSFAYDGLKRDLAKGGGVSHKNGRDYPTGRNWTNDHKHVNHSDDSEVTYSRKNPSNRHGYGNIKYEDGGFMNGVYADGGFMDNVYAKGGKVSPFENMMKTNTITEKEINLIKLRMNNDKVDEATQEAIDYIWDNSPQLTPDQNKKGIDYLRNLWKSPTGKERTNNPFGYREQEALETFEYFELRGFYDAGNRYRKFYVPLYTCVGKDSNFEYAFYNGEVNILG